MGVIAMAWLGISPDRMVPSKIFLIASKSGSVAHMEVLEKLNTA